MLPHSTTIQEHQQEAVLSFFPYDMKKRRRMYFLDFETVIGHLQGVNALLCTSFPHGIPPHPSPCRGYIRLKDGHIAEYWIEGQNGFRLRDALAAQYLRHGNEWVVELEQAEQSLPHVSPLPVQERSNGTHPAPPSCVRAHAFDELVFSQQCPLAPHLLAALSHKERMLVRMVHLMMDGRRSIEHIRQTLHLSSRVVEMAVRTLQRVQAIQEIQEE